jgi:hypothetical protein
MCIDLYSDDENFNFRICTLSTTTFISIILCGLIHKYILKTISFQTVH